MAVTPKKFLLSTERQRINLQEKRGTLYLCPTPIGNLEDITFRALKILKQVDFIAAEDTRVTMKLLNHYEIKTPLISYHEHNQKQRGPEIIQLLLKGKNVALVTDAGTPGISDPGEDLVKLAVAEGIAVAPLPGAVAAICALVASGLSTERFVFEGFLPRKPKERKQRLMQLAAEPRTVILYEAPHRLLKSLEYLKETLGNRRITVAREITKLHEEFFRGTIEQAIEKFENTQPRGEIILVIEGLDELLENAKTKIVSQQNTQNPEEIKQKLESIMNDYMAQGMSKKAAMKKAAEELGISRNEAYALLLK